MCANLLILKLIMLLAKEFLLFFVASTEFIWWIVFDVCHLTHVLSCRHRILISCFLFRPLTMWSSFMRELYFWKVDLQFISTSYTVINHGPRISSIARIRLFTYASFSLRFLISARLILVDKLEVLFEAWRVC